MNFLDRLLQHDDWTTQQMLGLCRGLTDEQLDREFDLGLRTLRSTFNHTIHNTEVWAALMDGDKSLPRGGQSKEKPASIEAMIERQKIAAALLARVAKAVEAREGWDEKWVDYLDDPANEKTYGGTIAHIITHSMHHRAQVIWMMKKLGVEGVPEGDVLSWEGSLGR